MSNENANAVIGRQSSEERQAYKGGAGSRDPFHRQGDREIADHRSPTARMRRIPRLMLAALSLLLSMAAAQAASVQENVNADPVICKRFLSALESDHLPAMTRKQLCSYDFMHRHSGAYFVELDWQRVHGDPVALTIDIFNANVLRSATPSSLKRQRDTAFAYAKLQNSQDALAIDMAAFGPTPIDPQPGASPQIYVLRSSASYCGDASSSRNEAERVRVAFFKDAGLQHAIASLIDAEVSEPVQINGHFYVIDTDTGSLHGTWYPPGYGPSYSADLLSLLISRDGRTLYSDPVCDFTIYTSKPRS